MREDGKQHWRRFRVATSLRTANDRGGGGKSLQLDIYALLLNTHVLQA